MKKILGICGLMALSLGLISCGSGQGSAAFTEDEKGTMEFALRKNFNEAKQKEARENYFIDVYEYVLKDDATGEPLSSGFDKVGELVIYRATMKDWDDLDSACERVAAKPMQAGLKKVKEYVSFKAQAEAAAEAAAAEEEELANLGHKDYFNKATRAIKCVNTGNDVWKKVAKKKIEKVVVSGAALAKATDADSYANMEKKYDEMLGAVAEATSRVKFTYKAKKTADDAADLVAESKDNLIERANENSDRYRRVITGIDAASKVAAEKADAAGDIGSLMVTEMKKTAAKRKVSCHKLRKRKFAKKKPANKR